QAPALSLPPDPHARLLLAAWVPRRRFMAPPGAVAFSGRAVGVVKPRGLGLLAALGRLGRLGAQPGRQQARQGAHGRPAEGQERRRDLLGAARQQDAPDRCRQRNTAQEQYDEAENDRITTSVHPSSPMGPPPIRAFPYSALCARRKKP